MKAPYRLTLLVLAALAIVPFFVQAAPTLSETLETVKNKYVFNDQINTAVTDGNTLYLGGSFSSVSQPIGQADVFDTMLGEFGSFPKIEKLLGGDNTVYSAVSDEDGGWYVGGDFDTVDGEELHSLVHVLSDGSVDTDFAPELTLGDYVYDMALSSDGGTLYVGGNFSTIEGTTRNDLAAFNTADGSLTSFNPNIGGSVLALALSSDDATLYIGGTFLTVNGGTVDRNRLAAIDTSDGTATSFDPDLNATANDIVLTADDSILYAAGEFLVVNGATGRNDIAAFDTSDGIATAFDPELNNGAKKLALSPDESTLYVAGSFTCVGYDSGLETCAADRNYLAGINTDDGLATDFDADMGAEPETLTLSSDGLVLYAGGNFTTVNGGTSRNRLAAFDSETGTVTDEDFEGGVSGVVRALVFVDGELFVGGNDMTLSVATRNEVAAIDLTTYELTDFDPNIVSVDMSVHALALSPDFGTLYIGGVFNGINGIGSNRSSLAAVSTSDGVMTDFDPDMPPTSTVYSLAVSSDGSTVYAGGDFFDWGASEVDYVAKMNATTGAQLAFAPSLDSTVRTLRLSLDGNSLYVGGDFTEHLVSLDSDDGSTLLTSELPANDSIFASALSSDGLTLYVGGSFTEFSNSTDVGEGAPFSATSSDVQEGYPLIITGDGGGGGATVYASTPDGTGGWYVGGSFTDVGATEQAALVHIFSDGTVDTDFSPVLDQETTNQIYSLILDGTTLYVAGEFSEINGTPRNNIAALDTTDGSLIAGFDPDVNGYVGDLALSSDGSVLYAGGGFTEVNSGTTPVALGFVAGFDTSDGTATAFDAEIDGGVNTLALSSNDQVLYVGGTFNDVNTGTTRNRLAAFTTADSVATAFDPDVNDSVYSIALSNDEEELFVGGLFDTVNGDNTERPYLAVFDTATGASTEFNPDIDPPVTLMDPDGFVNDISLSSDGSTLYIVGGFSTLYGQSRNHVAAISIAAGGSLGAFDPHLTTGESFIREIEFSDDGGIFIGGEPLNVVDSITRDHLAALDTSDLSFTDFDPGPFTAINALALSSDDELLYAGGNEFLRAYTNTGDTDAFSPSDLAGSVWALALSLEDDELYAGGDFTNKYAIYSLAIGGDDDDDSGDDDDDDSGDDDDDDDNGGGGHSGGGSGSHQKPIVDAPSFHGDFNLLEVLRRLILELLGLGGTVPDNVLLLVGLPISGPTAPVGTNLYARDLTLEDKGPDVSRLQLFLITQNKGPQAQALAAVGATGFFGPLTQAALAEYQASVGISATGYFGPLTRAHLVSIGQW